MTTLTTLFVVGPEEYVEFNESMGSKAFLEHVWDQRTTPLKADETSASGTHLHTAGARISPDPPLRIEFPTIVRIKGKGNKYKPTGRWISWEDLRKLNPLALNAPPSLEEFAKRGGDVGSGPKLEPGSWLGTDNRKTRPPKKVSKKGDREVKPMSDGWFGEEKEGLGEGSAESIYAPSATKLATAADCSPSSSTGTLTPTKATPEGKLTSKVGSSKLRQSASSRSLSERFGIGFADPSEEPIPPIPSTAAGAATEESTEAQTLASQGQDRHVEEDKGRRRPGAPTKLTLSDIQTHSVGASLGSATLPTFIARTPLSATHTPPETPLKHVQRGPSRFARELPATPRTEQAVERLRGMDGSATSGLLLDTGDEADFEGPKKAANEALSSEDKQPQPPSDRPIEATTSTPKANGVAPNTSMPTSSISPAKNQIDSMLAKLRQARSGFSSPGSSESRWASSNAKQERKIEAEKVDREIERLEKEKKEATTAAPAVTLTKTEDAARAEVPVSPPKAPRALREKEAGVVGGSNGKKNKVEASEKTLKVPKSPVDGDVKQHEGLESDSKSKGEVGKAKKERKRGSRSGQTQGANGSGAGGVKEDAAKVGENTGPKGGGPRRPSGGSAFSEEFSLGGAIAPTPSTTISTSRVQSELPAPVVEEETSKPSTNVLSSPKPQDQASEKTVEDVAEKDAKEVEEEEKTAGHVRAVSETASSVGNDTSFNWADDDDDEALPDLPEEWGYTPTKAPAVAAGGSDKKPRGYYVEGGGGSGWTDDEDESENRAGAMSQESKNMATAGGSEGGGAAGGGGSKRGSKRGGKGRSNKKDREPAEEGKGHNGTLRGWAEPPVRGKGGGGDGGGGSGGIKIAGVARERAREAGAPPALDLHSNGLHHPQGHNAQRRELFPDSRNASLKSPNGSASSPGFGRFQQQQQQQQQQRPPKHPNRHPDARAPLPPNAMPLSMAAAALGGNGLSRSKEPPRAPKADLRAAAAAASAASAAASKEQQARPARVTGNATNEASARTTKGAPPAQGTSSTGGGGGGKAKNAPSGNAKASKRSGGGPRN
ncbi:hypothetical protein FA10DRAFT_277916 [Acaromyces ingoldii]|uniref:Uncharacterized protein n=1 Tax=Acaromyces ingoldii TaxID=215250 RepID=A0A316YZZ2_9BASI|nr:hypothetical protein FA10DRAFT_277916 [Acaromyces ingoldii]PWN94354.1 hypothetical protein FA10DRAFT_277916 [Acaromyces ingoldii]